MATGARHLPSNIGSLPSFGKSLEWDDTHVNSPYIAMVCDQVFRAAVKIGLVQPWDEVVGGPYSALLPGPGGARAEAERRR